MHRNVLHATTLLLAGLTAACSSQIKLDTEEVNVRLDRIDETIPMCSSPDGSTMRLATALRQAVRFAPPVDGGTVLQAGDSCGGTLEVSSEHGNGNTAYEVVMDSYCIEAEDGPATYDGTVLFEQIGKPSDFGPVISASEASTDGPLTVSHADGTMEITLSNARTDYGVPAEWMPGLATESDPNEVRVGEVRIDYPDADEPRTDFVRDVTWEQYGDLQQTIRITAGQVGTVGDGHVSISTPDSEPVILDAGQLQVTSGAIELSGAGGTVLTVRPGTELGTMDLELDGEPMDRGIDCSAALPSLIGLGFDLILELPL